MSTEPAPARDSVGMRDPELEAMPRDRLERLQGERLVEQVAWVGARSAFFADRFAGARVGPADVGGLDDLVRLPTFAKDDLRRWRDATGDPFAGTLCVPAETLTFVTHSSGTSGRPNLFGLTLDEYEEMWKIYARTFHMAGLRAGDHAVMSGRNLWHAAARAFDRAFERMGVVKHFFGTPTQEVIPHLFESAPEVLPLINVTISLQPEAEIEYLRSRGLEPRRLCPSLRVLQTGVEMSAARRRLLEEAWGVPVHNHFGSGDQFWMTGQCPADERWNHAPEDYLIFEVLDPISRQPVADGGTGVLHVTNLWLRSFPFVRYDMEDMVAHTARPCPCGRTSRRLQMRGRLAWAIRVGDRYVFSQDVEEVLWAHPELTAPPYQLVRHARQPQQRLEVRVAVELRPALREELERALTGALDMPVALVEIPAGSIALKGMKIERVVTV